jgi:uncharacterized protein YrrD
MPEDTTPIAWVALKPGTIVTTSDGEEIGKVSDVIADEQKDIFSGITFKHGLFDREHFIAADQIAHMSASRVELRLTSQQAENLEPYSG